MNIYTGRPARAGQSVLRSALATLTCALALVADAVAGPAIQSWQTEAGARVMFVPAPEIAVLDVRVTFRAGSARDGAEKGVAQLTNDLLNEGAGDLDANLFAEQLGATGARLQTGARRDMAYIALRTLADDQYAEPALALLQLAMARPRFDTQAIARLKAQAQVAFKHKRQSPSKIAEEAFYAALYASHPYASPPDGTPTTVAALTREDVVAFHQRYYVASNAVISIVGQVDRQRAEAIASALNDALPAGTRAAALPQVGKTDGLLQNVEFPSIQSHVRVGLPGMSRTDPDYFALLVGNHVLGGNSLVSLLFQEIRSKRGLSYSAYSYFLPMEAPGPFIAAMQTDRTQQDEALNVLRETLTSFINDGPEEKAFEAAKQNLIGGFPLRVDSNQKIVEYIGMIGFYDLPLDYLDTFTSKVQAITLDDVRSAFARRVRPEEMVTVVVGRKDLPAQPQ